jgi:hypothetical protein
MNTKIYVTITTNPDSFFGNQEPPANAEAVLDAYQDELEAAILAEYPNAEIEMSVETTLHPVRVVTDDFSDDGDEIERDIEDIDAAIYAAGKFWDAK